MLYIEKEMSLEVYRLNKKRNFERTKNQKILGEE